MHFILIIILCLEPVGTVVPDIQIQMETNGRDIKNWVNLSLLLLQCDIAVQTTGRFCRQCTYTRCYFELESHYANAIQIFTSINLLRNARIKCAIFFSFIILVQSSYNCTTAFSTIARFIEPLICNKRLKWKSNWIFCVPYSRHLQIDLLDLKCHFYFLLLSQILPHFILFVYCFHWYSQNDDAFRIFEATHGIFDLIIRISEKNNNKHIHSIYKCNSSVLFIFTLEIVFVLYKYVNCNFIREK